MSKSTTFCSWASTIICSRCSLPYLISNCSPHPTLSALLFSADWHSGPRSHSHLPLHLSPFQLSLAFLSSRQAISHLQAVSHIGSLPLDEVTSLYLLHNFVAFSLMGSSLAAGRSSQSMLISKQSDLWNICLVIIHWNFSSYWTSFEPI